MKYQVEVLTESGWRTLAEFDNYPDAKAEKYRLEEESAGAYFRVEWAETELGE